MGETRSFASDNNAGVHPRVLEAIAAANRGHVPAYGDDEHTRAAIATIRRVFGEAVEVLFVFGGTGANVVGLAALTEPFEAVICPDTAHVYADECGAPERFAGCKLIPVPSPDGKLRVEQVRPWLRWRASHHHVQPRVLSITQATEYGTVYTPEEIAGLASFAREENLRLHMDGARLANAAARLGVSLRAITGDAGVEVLSFGGTKNGLLGAEAVVFFAPGLVERARFLQKQAMQLPSKTRFLAAQLDAILTDELWRTNAEQANRMATLLAEAVRAIPGVAITQTVEGNAVFARLPRAAIAPLRARYAFDVWVEGADEVRWMASYDTTEEDVRRFVAAIREEVGRVVG